MNTVLQTISYNFTGEERKVSIGVHIEGGNISIENLSRCGMHINSLQELLFLREVRTELYSFLRMYQRVEPFTVHEREGMSGNRELTLRTGCLEKYFYRYENRAKLSISCNNKFIGFDDMYLGDFIELYVHLFGAESLRVILGVSLRRIKKARRTFPTLRHIRFNKVRMNLADEFNEVYTTSSFYLNSAKGAI